MRLKPIQPIKITPLNQKSRSPADFRTKSQQHELMMVEIIIQNMQNNSISHEFTRNCSDIQIKLGCVVRMVVDSILSHAECEPNDHLKDAPPLISSSFSPNVTIIQLSSWSSINKKPRTPLIQCHGNYKLSRKPKNICSQKLTPQNELFLSIFVMKAS